MKRPKPIEIKRGNVIVKIYRVKTHGRNSFQVADYSSGRRKLISFSEEADARDKAAEIATKLARGEVDVLTLANKDKASYVRALRQRQNSRGNNGEHSRCRQGRVRGGTSRRLFNGFCSLARKVEILRIRIV
ncbi:MAG: hypothetical protein L0Y58_08195 [Verrucomicrobia subdivision 3 bacterium]|nr:hypothetical protein [Limisphaerales bacterium]